jgi:predicted transcriptional regulator
MVVRPRRGITPAHTVRVDSELWRAAQTIAYERGETVSDIARRAIIAYVRRHTKADDQAAS